MARLHDDTYCTSLTIALPIRRRPTSSQVLQGWNEEGRRHRPGSRDPSRARLWSSGPTTIGASEAGCGVAAAALRVVGGP